MSNENQGMIESLDRLRNVIMLDRHAGPDQSELSDLFNAIESEVEERYVELPKDADGFTITLLNEMVDSNGEPFIVSSMELLANGMWLLYGNGKLGSELATMCRHHKPPTVEDMLREFFSRYVTTKPKEEDDAIIAEYAAKLQLKEIE